MLFFSFSFGFFCSGGSHRRVHFLRAEFAWYSAFLSSSFASVVVATDVSVLTLACLRSSPDSCTILAMSPIVSLSIDISSASARNSAFCSRIIFASGFTSLPTATCCCAIR
eukprot:TRINITY_DN3164_c0_g1_i1.p1 TRINITY_DN3164_c0_g1~~TRINITY_DN3164_c0_g1_i1.p1  ORF type:complete len:111 (+),score=6.50 TRINITY_DN3164_c0_g1_i1:141-473(+)